MIKVKALAATLLLCGLSSNALAVMCTSTTSWGSLGPPGNQNFGHSFSSAGNYSDCYTFSLTSAANSFGGLIEVDPWLNRLDIDVTGVSLFTGGVVSGSTTGTFFGADTSPMDFGFGGLTLGTYSLVVHSSVARDFGLFTQPVGYYATIATTADRTGTTGTVPVPEPRTLAVLGLGLAAIGLAFRRRALRITR